MTVQMSKMSKKIPNMTGITAQHMLSSHNKNHCAVTSENVKVPL